MSKESHLGYEGLEVLQSWSVNKYCSKPHGMDLAATQHHASTSYKKLLAFVSHLPVELLLGGATTCSGPKLVSAVQCGHRICCCTLCVI